MGPKPGTSSQPMETCPDPVDEITTRLFCYKALSDISSNSPRPNTPVRRGCVRVVGHVGTMAGQVFFRRRVASPKVV